MLLGESLSDDVFVPPHMLGRSVQGAATASAVEPLRPVKSAFYALFRYYLLQDLTFYESYSLCETSL